MREGSEAETAGVEPGAILIALSDPIRNAEMTTLAESPSLRFVTDAVRLRRGTTITLVLRTAVVGATSEARVGSVAPAGSEPVSATTIRDSLQAAWEQSERSKLPTAVDRRVGSTHHAHTHGRPETSVAAAFNRGRRIQKREAYMAEVSKRNDAPLFVKTALIVFLPPAAILAFAATQGWLEATQLLALYR